MAYGENMVSSICPVSPAEIVVILLVHRDFLKSHFGDDYWEQHLEVETGPGWAEVANARARNCTVMKKT